MFQGTSATILSHPPQRQERKAARLPQGKVLREIDVLGKSPSNLCFGGPDGRTVYVTEVTRQRLVQFRVDRPGLAWKRWQRR